MTENESMVAIPQPGERWRFVPPTIQGEVTQVSDGRVWVETGPFVWQIRPLAAEDGTWVRLPDDHEDDPPSYADLLVRVTEAEAEEGRLRERLHAAQDDLTRARRGAASTEHMHQLAMRYLADAGVDTSGGWLPALAALCRELSEASERAAVAFSPAEIADAQARTSPDRVTGAAGMRRGDSGRPLIEMRETGLLWWINRVAFHPRGFAFSLVADLSGEVTGWDLEGDGADLWSFSTPLDDRGFERAQATFAAAKVAES